MIRHLIIFLLGYLRIEVRSRKIEQFLNRALEEGVLLWQIVRQTDRLYATLTLRDFFVLRRMRCDVRGRIHILQRRGWPFLVTRLRNRPGLLAGAFLCVAFLLWMSGHIWLVRVKVTGSQNLDPRAVAGVAAEAGLKAGARKSQLDMNRVQQHIRARMDEISWVVIRVQGTSVWIEVVEKVTEHRSDAPACVNLVARKSGVVEQVVPFAGEPMVKKGDTVTEGAMLVACSLQYWSGGRPSVVPGMPLPPRESVARTLVAQARVLARIRYQEQYQMPLETEMPISTGRQKTHWGLFWKEKPILSIGDQPPSFERYQEVRKIYGQVVWRNWKSPVELVRVTYDEIKVKREPVPVAKVLEQAREQMESRLRWTLGPSDKVLTPIVAEVVTAHQQMVEVQVTVETLEEITRPEESAIVPVP